MNVWGRTESALGTCTVMVGPATVPELARLFDPDAPYVYVECFGPDFGGNVDGWNDLTLPLTGTRSDLVTARFVSFDLLLPTATFLEIAADLENGGFFCAQVRHKPSGPKQHRHLTHPAALRNWYEKLDLVVAFDLPHRKEVAQVTALSDAAMNAALGRLGE